MKYDVFISYSRKDQVVVDEIRQLLDSNAITYWLDTEKVHMGSEFMADIVDAIENSTITLFISSSDSNNSIFTAKEVALAFNAGKYIIPYKIDNSSFSKKLVALVPLFFGNNRFKIALFIDITISVTIGDTFLL